MTLLDLAPNRYVRKRMVHMDVKDIITPLVGFVSAGGGAWLGAWIALNKYKKEKNWEYRVQTYRHVLALIEEIAFWGRSESSFFFGEGVPGGLSLDGENFDSSMRKLTQAKHASTLYFTEEFNSLLEQAYDEFAGLWFENANAHIDDDTARKIAFNEMAGSLGSRAYLWLERLSKQARHDLSINV